MSLVRSSCLAFVHIMIVLLTSAPLPPARTDIATFLRQTLDTTGLAIEIREF